MAAVVGLALEAPAVAPPRRGPSAARPLLRPDGLAELVALRAAQLDALLLAGGADLGRLASRAAGRRRR